MRRKRIFKEGDIIYYHVLYNVWNPDKCYIVRGKIVLARPDGMYVVRTGHFADISIPAEQLYVTRAGAMNALMRARRKAAVSELNNWYDELYDQLQNVIAKVNQLKKNLESVVSGGF